MTNEALEKPLIGGNPRNVSFSDLDIVLDETGATIKGHLRLSGGKRDAETAKALASIFNSLSQELELLEEAEIEEPDTVEGFGSNFGKAFD